MDPTISVSKGVFVFKNNINKKSVSDVLGKKNKQTPTSKKKSNSNKDSNTMFGNEVTEEIFYIVYKKTWDSFKQNLDDLHNINYTKTIKELLCFIENCYSNNIDNTLPAAALLTGINQPDHLKQFETMAKHIKKKNNSNIIILESRECLTLKNAIETMVYGFIQNNDSDEEEDNRKLLRKSQCTMQVLLKWYVENAILLNEYSLIVVLPDFECFNPQILQDFILILSSYCNKLPIILIIGIATSISNLHSTLPYNVTSKIQLKIFQTPSALQGLNKIIEEIILSPRNNFHISGKTLKFLTDIFLFYDFSVNGFVQAFKNCLMEHFLQGSPYALCGNYEYSLTLIKSLKHEDFDMIRKLPSFRNYVENFKNPRHIYSILTDNKYLEIKLPKILKKCHIFFKLSRCFLQFFFDLIQNLPKSPFGKTLRELYVNCANKEIIETDEYKECFQILKFFSKDEFILKVNKAIENLRIYSEGNFEDEFEIDMMCKTFVMNKMNDLTVLLDKVNECELQSSINTEAPLQNELKNLNRQELKEKLLQMTKQSKPNSELVNSIQNVLKFIENEIIYQHLCPVLKRGPALYELFVFSDIQTIRKNIVGAPRAALHIALNDPNYYLQCSCCKLQSNQQLLSTLPDVSIAYKLHLECGKLINLFDWLQAFRAVIELKDDDNNEMEEQVDPKIQARFTRAVAELQFLGYIKSSKRKTDHVSRLTW